ncbi:hypothetical protein [Bradyrhizobium sp. Ash2021]|uniref:hypothetical protein n=1 Tax=Bradyrhizobium sp. Ash2021 TaxID=2954771 RepID=UPI00281669A1|nr:hypothetical protein [Bradyrhizobium sp. Ash2021]WMT72671.1 hypothetical protein NL528_32340 [Bradyrhizobium sp. Ash2021]
MNKITKKLATACYAVALLEMFVVCPALAEPPDLSGVWIPDIRDQMRQEAENVPPWKPEILPQVQHLVAEEKAGRPFLVLSHCLPHGMPSWMLITHNAFELLTTPGRVTMLGEVDGNRMRRIYVDGRPHPEDPDLTLHGHSIGHWDGETLVVDTTAITPQAYIAISEAVGIPNNGDMHVLERLHLAKPNVLYDDLEITAPKVLSATWKTTRIFRRYPERHYEITEGECAQEDLVAGKDQLGNDIFVLNPQNPDGSVRAVK